MVVTMGQQYNIEEKPTIIIYTYINCHAGPPDKTKQKRGVVIIYDSSTIEPYNVNASKPSEHSPVRGENVKTFRWDHRLQRQNLLMAFKRVPRW